MAEGPPGLIAVHEANLSEIQCQLATWIPIFGVLVSLVMHSCNHSCSHSAPYLVCHLVIADLSTVASG